MYMSMYRGPVLLPVAIMKMYVKVRRCVTRPVRVAGDDEGLRAGPTRRRFARDERQRLRPAADGSPCGAW
jgi:hypothetical protein